MNTQYEVKLESNHDPVKKLRYYGSIINDLNRVQKMLKKIHTLKDADTIEAIFISSIITYGRVFVSGDRTKLNVKSIKALTGKELQFHTEVMNMRHQFIAHAGKNKYEKVEVYLIIDKTRKYVVDDTYEYFQRFSFIKKEADLLDSIIDKLKKEMKVRTEKIAKKYLVSLSEEEQKKLWLSAQPYKEYGPLYSSNYKIDEE
ncbi:MAG: hypothetical protein ACFB15_11925 [Cyclobacteriaceae bacterium]